MMHKGASRSPTAAKGAVAYVMQILLHMILCGEMQAIVVRLAGADTCRMLYLFLPHCNFFRSQLPASYTFDDWWSEDTSLALS